jgi:O-antigen/teichoic acid export membrane protein
MLNFSILKFLNLGLRFFRSIILAKYFGPNSYGIFGTLIVLQQYLSFSALGMREAITVELAKEQSNEWYRKTIFISSLSWSVFIGFIVLISLAVIGYYSHNELNIYLKWVGLVSSLSIVNEILININRDQGNYTKIALLEVLYSGIVLVVVFHNRQNPSIDDILISMAFSLGTLISIYIYSLNINLNIFPSFQVIRKLIKMGLPIALLSFLGIILNSFLIIISSLINTKTLTGLIVFANNIVVIMLFGITSIQWAMTSRSMQNIIFTQDTTDTNLNKFSFYIYFYLLLIIPILLYLDSILKLFFIQYVGAGKLAFYIFLFQSSLVLLFEEINYNVVKNHSIKIIYGYMGVIMMVVISTFILPNVTMIKLIVIGIFTFFVFSSVILYDRYNKSQNDYLLPLKILYLFFPISMAIIQYYFGSFYTIFLCIGFAILTLTNKPKSFS